MFKQVLRPIIRNVARNGTRSSSVKVPNVKLPTINDLYVPTGSWQEYYDKRQKVYNTKLFVGIAVLSATIAYISLSGTIFFNWGPPEEPVEPVEEK